jgi:hypothetical protein
VASVSKIPIQATLRKAAKRGKLQSLANSSRQLGEPYNRRRCEPAKRDCEGNGIHKSVFIPRALGRFEG